MYVMPPSTKGSYRHCQSLVKGLDMLAVLNRLPHGSGSISELALHTGIHRTTLKRLLETLREQGYLPILRAYVREPGSTTMN